MNIVPEGIFSQHIAVLGKTRSGKSSVMRLLVEDLLGRHQPVCIVDPKGDWWGIKLAADGKKAGYPVVIFGGEHGDVPIDSHAGTQVAELFATGNRPCLIDLGGWMPGERTQFWIDFASTLFRFTKGNRWLVIDEVHNFAPKGKVMDPQSGKALHWANRLASEGLGKGMALIFASQRPQKVHNDTLTSAETLIAMRVLHPSDRNAVSDWIKGCGDSEGSEVLSTLAMMERGEGWVWSPEISFGPKRVKFPMFKTYDSFRPQTVHDTKSLTGWAEVDLDEVRQKLAATIEKAKADDPQELRRQIAHLTAQLSKPGVSVPPVIDLAAINKAVKDERERWVDAVSRFQGTLDSVCLDLERGVDSFRSLRKFQFPAEIVVMKAPSKNDYPMRPAPMKSLNLDSGPTDGKLRAGAERMLAALAHWSPNSMSMGQMRAHAGMKKSGTFTTYLSDLRRGGYIEERNGEVYATGAGLEYCKHVPSAPASTDEVLAIWKPKLRDGARRMLDVLVLRGGEFLDREQLAEASGMTKSGTFTTYLSDLRTARLVVIDNRGVAANKETLFL